ALWAALPFVLLAGLVAFVRIHWFVPYGHYAGYNGFIQPNLSEYFRLFALHLQFFLNFAQPLAFAGALMTHDNPIFAWTAFIGALLVSAQLWRSRELAR